MNTSTTERKTFRLDTVLVSAGATELQVLECSTRWGTAELQLRIHGWEKCLGFAFLAWVDLQ